MSINLDVLSHDGTHTFMFPEHEKISHLFPVYEDIVLLNSHDDRNINTIKYFTLLIEHYIRSIIKWCTFFINFKIYTVCIIFSTGLDKIEDTFWYKNLKYYDLYKINS